MSSLRVVSLLASATEIVAALGCVDLLVGRSHECDWPPEIQALPVLSRPEIDIARSSAEIDAQVKARSQEAVSCPPDAIAALSFYSIDAEQLTLLRPDIILTQTQCEVCAVSERDVVAALARAAGMAPRIVALNPRHLSDCWQDIRRVGQALQRADAAEKLCEAITLRLAALAPVDQMRPRVAFLEWLDPLMGAGNWMPELIAAAGGTPCFGEAGAHSPWISWEELAVADPDIIVLSPCGYDLARTYEDLPLLQAQPIWHTLRAVQAGRVFAADGNAYFNRSGPRLVDSAEMLAAMLHGGDGSRDAWIRLP